MSRAPTPHDFAFSMRPVGDTGTLRGHVGAFCASCDREDWVLASNPGWGTRLFKQRGWLLGSRRNQDVCPDCAKRRHMPRRAAPSPANDATTTTTTTTMPAAYSNAATVPANPPQPANQAEPPRQPTWPDNRRIRAALDEAYDETRGLYLGNGSDAALAEKLNVPRAWVSAIRELFGPNRCEADDVKAEKLRAALRVAEDCAKRALDAAEQAEAQLIAIREAAEAAGVKL